MPPLCQVYTGRDHSLNHQRRSTTILAAQLPVVAGLPVPRLSGIDSNGLPWRLHRIVDIGRPDTCGLIEDRLLLLRLSAHRHVLPGLTPATLLRAFLAGHPVGESPRQNKGLIPFGVLVVLTYWRPGSRSKQTRAVNAYFDHMASNTKMKAGTACTVTQSKAVILLDASISVIILIKILSKRLDYR